MAVERHRYRCDRLDRSMGTNRSANSPEGASRPGCALRAHFYNHFLYPPWRLVRIAVCDNFFWGAALALLISSQGCSLIMNQELEQEYSSLTKKVHDLREYL